MKDACHRRHADDSRLSCDRVKGHHGIAPNEKPGNATIRVRKEEFEARSQIGHLVCIQLVRYVKKKKSAVACRRVKAHKTTTEGASASLMSPCVARSPSHSPYFLLNIGRHRKEKRTSFVKRGAPKSRSFRSGVPIQREGTKDCWHLRAKEALNKGPKSCKSGTILMRTRRLPGASRFQAV